MNTHLDEKPKEVKPRSPIGPIPCYPNLARELKSIHDAVVVAYLELHHPAPQDTTVYATRRLVSPPVTVDMDAACVDLQLHRRTLVLSLIRLCSWFRWERERSVAARAGREFAVSHHSRYFRTKPYSIVGPKTANPLGNTWIMRRNLPLITSLTQSAGLSHATLPLFTALPSSSAPATIHTALSLSEIVAGRLGMDRRSSRQERERLARERGLNEVDEK